MEQLSEDVRRHLVGLPVLARPDTLAYRALKFAGRNRLAIAVSLLLGASLAAGVVSTSVQRSRAERRFAEVRSLAHAVLFQYQDAVQALPGSNLGDTRGALASYRKSLALRERLAARNPADRGARRDVARSL